MTTIDDLPDNLPRTGEKLRAAFEECVKEKRAMVKTRTYVRVPGEFYRDYIDSALTALNAARILLENGAYEWAIAPAYSAVFQAGNAVVIQELEKEMAEEVFGKAKRFVNHVMGIVA